MKAGTSASIFTYRYLHRLARAPRRAADAHRRLRRGDVRPLGRPLPDGAPPGGARRLPAERRAEQPLDHPLRREGPAVAAIHGATPGAHGAYTHLTPSATKIAARIIVDLEDLTRDPGRRARSTSPTPLAGAAAAIDEAQGAGAKDIVQKVTVNIGVIHGGQKVNMVPGTCWFEADIRLPPGVAQGRGDGAGAGDRRALPGGHDGGDQLLGAQRVRSEPRDGRILRANARALGGPSPRPSSASAAPTRGSGASAASPGSSMARSPAAWPRPTSTSRSRSTCTSSACTCYRRSTTSRGDRVYATRTGLRDPGIDHLVGAQ